MGRRWWIASGVLLGVLALTSYGLTRAADPTVAETSALANVAIYGPETWAPGPAAVLGVLLVVAGLLVAVAAVAYALGRRHAGAGSGDAAAVSGAELSVEPVVEPAVEPETEAAAATETPPTDRPHRTRGWALPVALSASLVLVTGGLLLVVTDPSSGYTGIGASGYWLTNGAKGIAPLDNVAALPDSDVISFQGFAVQVGVIPDVSGLPFAVARMVIQNAGFADVELADLDGDGLPDADDPGRVVDTVSPAAGTSPGTGVQVVVSLR